MYSFAQFVSAFSTRALVRFGKSAALPIAAALLCAHSVKAQCPNADFGEPNDVHVYGDFDGDGKLDYAFFRPSNGCWYVRFFQAPNTPQTLQFGLPGDIPVPADYDGLGITNYAVWRPSNGTWYIKNNTPPGVSTVQFGLPGDIPVTGVYDASWCVSLSPPVPAGCSANPKASFAVWRPSNGTWYITQNNNGGAVTSAQWGLAGDVPLAGDWDGDGKQDLAVWRPSNGTYYIIPSSTPTAPIQKQWGVSGDVPLPADYDLNSTGQTSYAAYRPSESNMYLIEPSNANAVVQPWGPPNGGPATNLITSRYSLCEVGKSIYVRVQGDFDGDHKADFAFWRPRDGTWYIVPSSNPALSYIVSFGLPGDIPVAADYNHDGTTDIAVWRPSNGTFYILPSTGVVGNPVNTGAEYTQQLGLPGDIPQFGDFNGDGIPDFAVWRPSNGTWYGLPNTGTTVNPGPLLIQQFGLSGDVPVAGDFDGDHKTDYAVWRPSNGTWYVMQSSTGTVVTTPWGLQGDLPVAADFDGDGKADFAILRSSSASWWITPSNGGGPFTIPLGVAGNDVVYAQPPLTTAFISPDFREHLETAFTRSADSPSACNVF